MSNFLSAAENAARQRQNDTCPVNLLTLLANDLYFKPGMSDFATAVLLIRIGGACVKHASLLVISYECRNCIFGSQGLDIRSG